MGEKLLKFLSDFGYQIAVGLAVLVVAAAINASWKAARNWREITERMATSKKAREHRKLTTYLIRAVNRGPIISALSSIFFLVGMFAAGSTGFMGYFASHYSVRFSAAETRAELAKERMSALAVKAPEPTVESLRKQFDEEMKRVEASIALGKMGLGATHVLWTVMALLTAYTFFKALPERLTMLPFAVWLDQYATRLFAMCTKDEARQLAILELKVMDEESLRAYLTRLGQLSIQYDFPMISQVASWLIESERRRQEGLV